MKLLIFGPPGSGKGTYASRLAPILNIAKISTGDIFREAVKQNTDLGKKVAEFLNKGELVPDEITIEVLKDRISKPDAKNGFILDGYPRTVPQAEALEKITNLDALINLKVPMSVIVERLSTRRTCKNCGEIYNVKYLKPKVEGICDKCSGELYQREDDKPEVIEERFKVYQKQSKPVINFYKSKIPFANVSCRTVDIPPEIVVDKILVELKKLGLIKG
jgi:adenylate kinase